MCDAGPQDGKEHIAWDRDQKRKVTGTRPDAKYGPVSETLRHTIPAETSCSLFCGGRKCKYCTRPNWRDDQMAVKGLYSHWVTDNILATARPTKEGNDEYNYVQQFKEFGIKTLINLQTVGEHKSCGPPLQPCGFSYNPQTYMDNDIFAYNYEWPDYNVGSLANLLDMVKVMHFALSEGKVAVHCHAGLGRTGVMIAACLVFVNRMDPHEAVHYVRSKRPGAIQTRTQVQCIEEFSKYLTPFWVVFSNVNNESYEFTLNQYLIRQHHILHGMEARELKKIPKVVYVCSERLLTLAQRDNSKVVLRQTFKVLNSSQSTLEADESEQRPFYTLAPPASMPKLNTSTERLEPTKHLVMPRACSMNDLKNGIVQPKQGSHSPLISRHGVPKTQLFSELDGSSIGTPSANFFLGSDTDLRNRPQRPPSLKMPADQVAAIMASTEYPEEINEQVESLKSLLNEDSSTWLVLQEETDVQLLSKLMWDWLDHLKEPVLSVQDMPDLLNHADDALVGLGQLDKGVRCTIEYLFLLVARLAPLQEYVEFELIQRILSLLCHQNISIDSDVPFTCVSCSTLRRTANMGEMTSSLASKLIQFAYNLLHTLRARLDEQKKKVCQVNNTLHESGET